LFISYNWITTDIHPRDAQLDVFLMSVVGSTLGWSFSATVWGDIRRGKQLQIRIIILCQ
jgi:hypothetical protein